MTRRKNRLPVLIIAGVLALGIAGGLAAYLPESLDAWVDVEALEWISDDTQKQDDANIRTAQVVRVVDGDTAVFNDGGGDFRVRFIGIDAPEMGFHNSEYEPGATEATEFVSELLVPGRVVYLEIGTPSEDTFGRVRAYIWLDDPASAKPRESMLNALLLKEGYAEVSIRRATNYEELFCELEAQAKEQGLGIWGL